MKQFLFDTNVIISAHLLKHSISRKAFDIAFEKGLVIYSEETLEELAATFIHSKFDKYISLESRLSAISEFEKRSYSIQIKTTVNVSRDNKDNKFLSLALSASADCIITGDKDLLVLHPFQTIPILSPAEYLSSPLIK